MFLSYLQMPALLLAYPVAYFQELGYLYSGFDTYLEREKACHQVIARLYEYQL